MDYARTLMMKKNISLKYWREVVSTIVYNLSRIMNMKGTNIKLYELWFGHDPSLKYCRIFGTKYYILKYNRNGKLDAKGEEGILLDYSTRGKY